MTAPVAITLMRPAPRCRISRTTLRTSSTEFATPKRRSRGRRSSTSTARPGMSPPPDDEVTNAPAQSMRGPGVHPASMASRRATSTKARKLPTSRTVVKPAMTVSRALRTPVNASWAWLLETSAAYPLLFSSSPIMCVCMSMRPGSTVWRLRSTTVPPVGSCPKGTTALIRSPSMTMARSVSTSAACTSMRRPARTTVRRSEVGMAGTISARAPYPIDRSSRSIMACRSSRSKLRSCPGCTVRTGMSRRRCRDATVATGSS